MRFSAKRSCAVWPDEEDADGPVAHPASAKPANAKLVANAANAVRRMFREKTIGEKAFRVDHDRGRDRKLAIFMDSVDPLGDCRPRVALTFSGTVMNRPKMVHEACARRSRSNKAAKPKPCASTSANIIPLGPPLEQLMRQCGRFAMP
jgi:hypothetical protein